MQLPLNHLISYLASLLTIEQLLFIPENLDTNALSVFMKYLIELTVSKLCFLVLIYTSSLLYTINCYSQTQVNPVNLNEPKLNMETLLSTYIQFESVSGQEKEAGEFLKKTCEDNDLYITQMGNENGNYNFAASIRPLSENLPNIIFLNHIDVVPSGDPEKWKLPPFSGTITDHEIWGRGAFDNKGTAIMQLASIIEISKKNKTPYNVTFLAVSCEETQCNGGATYVAENYFEELNPVLVIGEGPPELSGVIKPKDNNDFFAISVAHKRAFWVQLDIELETTGHGSVTPDHYANKEMVTALNKLIKQKPKAEFSDLNRDILKQLAALKTGFNSFILKHPKTFKPLIVRKLREKPEIFSLFSNSITLTSINSNNDVVNVIPTSTKALLDCRLLPSQSRDEFLKDLTKTINNKNIKITVLNEMPEMKVADENNIFYKNLKNAILKKHPNSHVLRIFIPNFNDTGVFNAKGVTTLACIPIKMDIKYLDNVHNYNERIPRGILKQGRDVYLDFLETCFDQIK